MNDKIVYKINNYDVYNHHINWNEYQLMVTVYYID